MKLCVHKVALSVAFPVNYRDRLLSSVAPSENKGRRAFVCVTFSLHRTATTTSITSCYTRAVRTRVRIHHNSQQLIGCERAYAPYSDSM